MRNLKLHKRIVLLLFLHAILFPPVVHTLNSLQSSSNSKNYNRNNGKFPKLGSNKEQYNKSRILTRESYLGNDTLARYAFTFLHNENATSGTNSSDNMAATAIGDIMSQIRDPLKHGVTSAVLAGLYILALISLIVFASSGTLAFLCSFIDCRNFFLGMKPENAPRRRRDGQGNGNFLDSSPELVNLGWQDEPIFEERKLAK